VLSFELLFVAEAVLIESMRVSRQARGQGAGITAVSKVNSSGDDLKQKTQTSRRPSLRALLFVLATALSGAVSSCGPPSIRTRDSQRRENACKVYTEEAVAQNQKNLDRGCGFSGGRWTFDYAGHFRWCMGVDITYSVGEMVRRNEMLAQECSSAQQPGRAVGTPKSPEPQVNRTRDEEDAPGELTITCPSGEKVPFGGSCS